MATVKQYQSGEAGAAVRRAIEAMRLIEGDLAASDIGKMIIANVASLAPLKIKPDQAAELIGRAETCAVGDRVCQCEFAGAPATESVFLDDLAEGMAAVGKARLVSKEEAAEALAKNKGKPIVITKVEGKYQEVCRTWHESCCYWNLEKRGHKCLGRYVPPEQPGQAGGGGGL